MLVAYSKVEPFGFEMENWRAAMTSATIARSAGFKGVKVEDFYPEINKPIEVDEQDRDTQIAILMQAATDGKPS